jgi:hypothetical protein
VVADFQEVYTLSLTPTFLRTQTWPWLASRVIGLLSRPARYVQIEVKDGTQIIRVPTTRLGMALYPPAWPESRE